MKKITIAFMLAAMAAFAQYAAAQDGGMKNGKMMNDKTMGDRMMKEKAPHMKAALRSLEEAKKHLEEAAHTFGGHREKALVHTNEAIREVKEGLEYKMKDMK